MSAGAGSDEGGGPPPGLANEDELYFERGGPVNRLMQRIGLIKPGSYSIGRRVWCFWLVAWVPPLVFTLFSGRAIGPTPRESFLLDYATYARIFIGVPLLFAAEGILGPRLRDAALRFVRERFVRPQDIGAVEAAVERLRRSRESLAAELFLLALAASNVWSESTRIWENENAPTWYSNTAESGLSTTLAGIWHHGVVLLLVQFVMLRWMWRLVLWIRFLRAMSRLRLDIVPTHSDRAGGLLFLGHTHLSLGLFAFAASCVMSAEMGFRVQYEAAPLARFQAVILVWVVLVELVVFGPLLMFSSRLTQARFEARKRYSQLVLDHNRAFRRKWVDGVRPKEESPLGNQDMSSLVDLGSSYNVVEEMNIVPFRRPHVLKLALITLLPMVPLALLTVPLKALVGILQRLLM